MPKARKKPVVIEFEKITPETIKSVAKWCGGIIQTMFVKEMYKGVEVDAKFLVIDTLEGEMTGRMGDLIIKGVHGEFYPCKPDIFEKTYEVIDEPTD